MAHDPESWWLEELAHAGCERFGARPVARFFTVT
jgi:hypothetical protein